jgi:HEAT repeat protein
LSTSPPSRFDPVADRRGWRCVATTTERRAPTLELALSLCDILENQSQPAALRDQAAESLGYLEDARARDALLRNIADDDADVVFSCIFALRTVGELEDTQHLQNYTRRDTRNSYGASIADEAREAIEEIRQRAMRHGPREPSSESKKQL